MKIIVTGGSGFIGSHLTDCLIERGHKVTILDIETPRYHSDAEFIRGDVTDIDLLISVFKDHEIVYHLAAEANVNRFYEKPLYSNLITSVSTLTVLEAARQTELKRVLLASTEWVYGSSDSQDEITEEIPYTVNPDHLYTSSKISAELFCKNYRSLYGVNYTIMRYGIPFGERAREETVTPIFIKKIIKGDEILIHGDGSQTRQFIYVKDLAQGNVACLKPEAENEIFNLNGREIIKIIDIVRTLEELLGKKAKIRFVEDRKGNYKGRFISSEKAERLLGWKPRYNYREAMEKYLSNYLSSK
ncbi:MAG: NAD-dependent epimerase/dehydratase family protein [Ignavibacteria bacterium]|nr:NAD-dependent epimerase/dehydratase family protein [Ignavibacteria bacterium]